MRILLFTRDGVQKEIFWRTPRLDDSTWTFVDSKTKLIKQDTFPKLPHFIFIMRMTQT